MDPTVIDSDLHVRFINGLRRLGLDPNVVVSEYKYCGGDYENHKNYWELVKSSMPDDTPDPLHEDNCVCGQAIVRNAYIKNDDHHVIVVGSCCIKQFMPNGLHRTCEVCGEEHRNRKVNRCNECRVGVCDDCGGKCSEKYSVCYSCKTGIPKTLEKDENVVKGVCQECGGKCSDQYNVCYHCKMGIPKPTKGASAGKGLCQDCGVACYSGYPRYASCSYKRTAGGDKSHASEITSSSSQPETRLAASLQVVDLTLDEQERPSSQSSIRAPLLGVCRICQGECDPMYPQCRSCYYENMNTCRLCGAPCKKPYTQCWKCHQGR